MPVALIRSDIAAEMSDGGDRSSPRPGGTWIDDEAEELSVLDDSHDAPIEIPGSEDALDGGIRNPLSNAPSMSSWSSNGTVANALAALPALAATGALKLAVVPVAEALAEALAEAETEAEAAAAALDAAFDLVGAAPGDDTLSLAMAAAAADAASSALASRTAGSSRREDTPELCNSSCNWRRRRLSRSKMAFVITFAPATPMRALTRARHPFGRVKMDFVSAQMRTASSEASNEGPEIADANNCADKDDEDAEKEDVDEADEAAAALPPES